jgi:hypothetical protein
VDGGIYSAPEEKRVPAAHRGHEYHAFIDEIIATAKMTKFLRPIGVGEDRLKGFHGG